MCIYNGVVLEFMSISLRSVWHTACCNVVGIHVHTQIDYRCASIITQCPA